MDSTNDTAGLVSWDDDIDFSERLTSNFTHLKGRVDDVDTAGGTDLDVGLEEAGDI